MIKEKIILLGATGSIGTQALDVLKNNPQFELVGVTLNSHFEKLEEYLPFFPNLKAVGIVDNDRGIAFKEKYQTKYDIAYGESCNKIILNVTEHDSVINAIMGNAGLEPTLIAIENNKTLYLSNKESLIMAGNFIRKLLKKHPQSTIYPIDSEHVGLNKLINYFKREGKFDDIDQFIITASGGALRDTPIDKIKNSKPQEVLKHPTWNMGSKITIDSATMVNKAYEVIEASVLFNIDIDLIHAIICYESTLHAGVKVGSNYYYDYSINDMHEAIKFSLSKGSIPSNIISDSDLFNRLNQQNIDNKTLEDFTFKKIEEDRYPLFFYILSNYKKYSYPFLVTINTADELVIKAFLKNEICFNDITNILISVGNNNIDQYKKVKKVKDIFKLIELTTEQTILLIQEYKRKAKRKE